MNVTWTTQPRSTVLSVPVQFIMFLWLCVIVGLSEVTLVRETV